MSFEEQIMSNDKYPSIVFAPDGDLSVYYLSNIFATRAVLKDGEYPADNPQL